MESQGWWRGGAEMNARTIKNLEKVWLAEIAGRNCQLAPRTMEKLAAQGLVELVTERFGVPPLGVMEVKMCRLTHAGRWAYCETCEEPEHDAP